MKPPYSLVLRLALAGLTVRWRELEHLTRHGAPFDRPVSAELDDLAQLEDLLLAELAEAA